MKMMKWLFASMLFMSVAVTFAAPTDLTVKELFWDAPTTNTDGTPLTDLAGFRVYCRTPTTNYVDPGFQIADPAARSVLIAKIVDVTKNAVYYCVATPYDTEGYEGQYSKEVSFLVAGGVAAKNVSVPAALPSLGVR